LFVSISQVIVCEDRPRYDLDCVRWALNCTPTPTIVAGLYVLGYTDNDHRHNAPRNCVLYFES